MKKELQYLNRIEKRVLMSFVKELKEALGNELVSIKLFGSKVRGDFGRDSDIDIFILVKQKTFKIRDIIAGIEVDYDIKYGLPISTVLYSLYEYKKNEELGSFFFENVEKEGIPL